MGRNNYKEARSASEVTLFLGSTSGLGTRSCTCGLGAGLTVVESVCVFQVYKFKAG